MSLSLRVEARLVVSLSSSLSSSSSELLVGSSEDVDSSESDSISVWFVLCDTVSLKTERLDSLLVSVAVESVAIRFVPWDPEEDMVSIWVWERLREVVVSHSRIIVADEKYS